MLRRASCAQFELLAEALDWNRYEKEVLNQLTAAKRTPFSSMVAILERQYNHQYQLEVYRARFRARIRGSRELLTHLVQDMEHLVRRAYPEMNEDMVTILLWNQFVDAVDHSQTHIYI